MKEPPWLDTYLRGLLSFPNSKYDDHEQPEPGIIGFYRQQAEQAGKPASDKGTAITVFTRNDSLGRNPWRFQIPNDRVGGDAFQIM
jgi:hypothetical protein